MPTVIFESNDGQADVTVEAPDGGALADLCDDANAPVPFSCRSANCGTCRIHVLAGDEGLLPAEDDELDVLDIFVAAPPRQRLACQAKMSPGTYVLRLRAVPDDE